MNILIFFSFQISYYLYTIFKKEKDIMKNRIYKYLSISFFAVSLIELISAIVFYIKGNIDVSDKTTALTSLSYNSAAFAFNVGAVTFFVLAILFIFIYDKNKQLKEKNKLK